MPSRGEHAKRKKTGSTTKPPPSPKRYIPHFMPGYQAELSFSPSFYNLRRGTRRTIPKIPASRTAANPAPNSSTRTGANTGVAPTHPPHEDSDDVSITNSEVESVLNHRRLKETLRAPAFSEQEFTALSTVDAYIQAAREGLTGVTHLFLKDIQVKICVKLIDMYQYPRDLKGRD